MNNKIVGIAAVVVSAAAGAVAGYFFAESRMKKHYAEVADNEIREMRDYYSANYKKDDFSSPLDVLARRTPRKPTFPADGEMREETAEEAEANQNHGAETFVKSIGEKALEEIVDRAKYGKPNHLEGTPPRHLAPRFIKGVDPDILNGSTHEEDHEISQEDIANRSIDTPYVISFAEFMENEDGSAQSTWTYYRGDKTLADDADGIVVDVQEMVGIANLNRFGYGSRDPNIVYVKNDRIGMIFEICLSEGEYGVEVAGFVPDVPDQSVGKKHRNAPQNNPRTPAKKATK
jgi:hypothetical protein